MQSIRTALANISFPEPEKSVELPEVVIEAPVEEAIEAAPALAVPFTEVSTPIVEEINRVSCTSRRDQRRKRL